MENKKLLPPMGKVDVILDTDAFNEIDDQFAISYLLKNDDRLNCLALCAAPFFNKRSTSPKDGMEKSYTEILKLLKLLGKEETPVFKGSDTYLPDEQTPVISPAAEYIAKCASEHTSENPLYVVAIGAITNVASAMLIAPEAIKNVVIVWLGGNARQFNSTREFNMIQDIAAARVAMSCGASFVQLPCVGVVELFRTNEPELKEWLYNTTPIAHYLAENTVKYCNPNGEKRVWSKVIWDVTAVAWLINDDNRFMSYEIVDTVLPNYDNHLEAQPINEKMCYVTRIFRDELMADLFTKLCE